MVAVEFFVLLLLIGALAFFVVPRIMGRRGSGGPGGGLGGGQGGPGGGRGGFGGFGGRGGAGGNMAPGTLLVTGVSAGADSDGSQFVTLTGVINGPTVSEHEIYARTVMPVGTAPTIGQLIPIAYSPKNPDKWGFAPPDVPEQASDYPPPPPDYPPPPPNYPPPPPNYPPTPPPNYPPPSSN